jgi:hypothetical protein
MRAPEVTTISVDIGPLERTENMVKQETRPMAPTVGTGTVEPIHVHPYVGNHLLVYERLGSTSRYKL